MKTLYTIGDSFTYGQELPNPEKQAWPVLLADNLGYRLINEGSPGVGNEYIVKQTVKAVAKHKPDLVVIGWTSCGRQEYADKWGVYDIWPGCNSRTFSEDRSGKLEYRHELIKYISKHNNDIHEYRRWLRQVILLQSFLQNHKIDYIMCNVFDNQQRFDKYYKDNQGYYELVDHTKFVGWPNDGFVEWAYGTPHGSGGHPLEQGHKQIAEKIYEACNNTR
jgi:lysophospholipase L1-like esterase